ncbi:MAG: hypothetical protein HXX18_14740 [Bacteroidetes bacterium]|nr:hypothetical protein [Bacteroidota bacterium]
MEKHLKERQEYVDRYDKITVDRCRWAEKAITADFVKKHLKESKDEKEWVRSAIAFNNLHLYFMMGEMYKNKEKTIAKWMKEDEEHDNYFENAEAPKDILCFTCSREMFVTHKQLETRLDKPDRVLFVYDCTLGHIPRRSFYDNGEEWQYKKPLCSKCSNPFDILDEDTDELWKTISTCSKCGNTETSEIKKKIEEEKPDQDYGKDRARFCSKKDGEKYVDWMRTADNLSSYLEKQKEKENNKELYEAVNKIKKLKIIELEQLLAPVFEEAQFTKLQFKDPQITKDVVVPFTVHDIKQGREDRVSCLDLQSVIKKTLNGTNWKLMNEGVNYRLGMLEGRLKAYEKEEDLVKLVV